MKLNINRLRALILWTCMAIALVVGFRGSGDAASVNVYSIAPAGCVSILSPANGATFTLNSPVTVKFSDTCTNHWYECLLADGSDISCATPYPQQLAWTASTAGNHTLAIRSWSRNGAKLLGSASISVKVQRATPTPVPTSTPTPTPCITISSPVDSSNVSGTVAIRTSDSCSGTWYESLYVDSGYVGDFATSQVNFNSVAYANGRHTIEVTSQSQNPASLMLGSASEVLYVANTNPTPTSTPTPAPVSSSTPSPTATPAPGVCVSIISPTPNSLVSGSSVAIKTTDNCAGNWYESLYLDSTHIGDFATGQIVFNSVSASNGTHTVEVISQSQNPATVELGSAAESINVQNTASPTPTSTATPTPSPTPTQVSYYSLKNPNATLPSESTCISAIEISPLPEAAPWNENDGTGYNSNQVSFATPSYYYQHVGEQLGFTSPIFQLVDGHYAGSTDDIARITACKWGMDEDVLRAQMEQESAWHQDCADMHGGSGCNEDGDHNNSDGSCSGLPANLSGLGWQVSDTSGNFVGPKAITNDANAANAASWSIIQSKSACAEWYAWPMLATSTAWALDYRGAKFRACMNGDFASRFNSSDYNTNLSLAGSSPNSPSTQSDLLFTGETNVQRLEWGCIGTHYSGSWYDSGAFNYDQSVYNHEEKHDWPGGIH